VLVGVVVVRSSRRGWVGGGGAGVQSYIYLYSSSLGLDFA
jgi:hypothetical protein